MTRIIVTALGIGVAGLLVWLTVRIVNRREKWAKITAAITIFSVFVLYPLSTGPATWLLHHYAFSKPAIGFIRSLYDPLELISPLDKALSSWQALFIDMGWPSVLKEREEREREEARRKLSANPP